MKRQKTIGLYPSSSSSVTVSAEQLELGVALAFELAGAGREAAQPPAVRRLAVGGVAVGAGGGVGGLDGLLVGQVEDGGAAEPVGFGLVLGVEVGRPGAQGGGRGPRRGGQRAQQRQRGPVADPLPQLAAFGVADGFAGVVEHVVEQFLVRPGAGRRPLLGLPVFGERGGLVEEDADVAAAALDEVAGQQFPALDRFEVHVLEIRVAAGRAGCGTASSLPLCGVAVTRIRCRWRPWPGRWTSSYRCIRDRPPVPSETQVWASSMISRSGQPCQELVAAPGALDEVGRHDDVRVPVEERLALEQASFQPADGAGQHQLGVDAELARAAPAATARRARGRTARPGRCASPCSSSSAAIRPASTVLPMPTSSAISSRTVSCRSAISSGTSW